MRKKLKNLLIKIYQNLRLMGRIGLLATKAKEKGSNRIKFKHVGWNNNFFKTLNKRILKCDCPDLNSLTWQAVLLRICRRAHDRGKC